MNVARLGDDIGNKIDGWEVDPGITSCKFCDAGGYQIVIGGLGRPKFQTEVVGLFERSPKINNPRRVSC